MGFGRRGVLCQPHFWQCGNHAPHSLTVFKQPEKTQVFTTENVKTICDAAVGMTSLILVAAVSIYILKSAK